MVGPGEESCGLWCGHACCIVGGRAWGGGVMLAAHGVDMPAVQ